MINRISDMFRERYGTKLKIQWTSNTAGKKPVFMSHWQNPFVYSRTLRQVTFPLFNSKNELQAIAIASPVENKDAIIFDEMSHFLQLTVAEHLNLSERRGHLIKTEQAIQLAHKVSGSNIVQFKNRKSPEPQIQFKKKNINSKTSFQPIWISGDSSEIGAHIAFSIHDWISNWAFINAREIPDLIWQDKNHWQKFPQITIFIPDVEDLNANQLQILKENLKVLASKKDQKPLIVVTSRKELSPELEELKLLFRHYQANTNVPPRTQAHFLLFHHRPEKPWSHFCRETGKVYFLPLGQSPTNFH